MIIQIAVFIPWIWQGPPSSLGISISASEAAVEQSTRQETSEVYVIKDLPCFKCHIYERFVQEPAPGVFSHALHVQFEYHCNQCHSFSGHREMIINTTLCTYCHKTVPELKKH